MEVDSTSHATYIHRASKMEDVYILQFEKLYSHPGKRRGAFAYLAGSAKRMMISHMYIQ